MENTQATILPCAQCGRPHAANVEDCSAWQAPVPTSAQGSSSLDQKGDDVSSAPLPSGSVLAKGRYRIERCLGKGGFGVAYLARDIQMQRPCVIKQLTRPPRCSRQAWLRLRSNFRREAEALARLNTPGHPNIPEIYDYLDRPCCLVMKYIEGRSLAALFGKHGEPLAEAEALRYARDVCSALVYMHSRTPQPVLHRDIKPSNILLDTTGRIWLIDFGLARELPGADLPGGSSDSLVAGTPGYTPLEQWRGTTSARSDVYALGVTLRELLDPFGSQQRTPMSIEVEQLLGRATAVEVEQRVTAEEFYTALDSILTRPSVPTAFVPDRPPEVQSFIGREAEIATLVSRLQRRHIAVIAGLAGVGKTSLAVKVAERAHDPQQIFWHTFHPGEHADRLLRTLAAFVVAHGQTNLIRLLRKPAHDGAQLSFEQTSSYVLDTLRGRGFVLCLDDAQLVAEDEEAVRFLSRLRALALAGELGLLVTSRQFPQWAQSDEVLTIGGLSDADARDLLYTRGVTLSAEVTDQILVYTEGNAKFLHLAVDVLEKTHNAAHLVSALAETDDIASYLVHEVNERLDEHERAVMGACAALLGYGGTRAAIEHMLGGDDCWEALVRLRERYLLIATSGTAGTEYVQHALVRSFYYQRLNRHLRRQLHQRAGSFYMDRHREPLWAARHLIAADEHQRAAQLLTADIEARINEGEAAELRRLLGQIDPARVDSATSALLCDAYGAVATLDGNYVAARQKLEQALAYGAASSGDATLMEAQARRYRLLAVIHERTGDYERAQAACHQGLVITGQLASPNVEAARLYTQLAAVLWRMSEFDASEQACAAGLAFLPPGIVSRRERIALWQWLSRVDIGRGRYAEAVQLLEQSLTLARELDDAVLVATVQYNLGTAHYHRGEAAHAKRSFEESLALRAELGDEPGRIEAFNGLGLVHMANGEHHEALRCFGESAELCGRLGMPSHRATALLNLGQLLLDLGRPADARPHLVEARAIYTALGNRHKLAQSCYLLGDIALMQGQPIAAREAGEQALALARTVESPSRESCALRVIGEALTAQGQLAQAEQHLAEAWRLQDSVDDPYDKALILAGWAELAFIMHDPAMARARAETALALAREQHVPALISRLETLLADIDARAARDRCVSA